VLAPVLAAAGAAHAPDIPLLSVVVLTPVLGAVVTALVSRRRPEVAKQVAVLFATVTGALTVAVAVAFDTHEAGFQLVDRTQWISQPDIAWSLGVDGISLWLVVLTGILFPIAMLGAPPHHDGSVLRMLLVLEAAASVLPALDLFLFFVMFEIVLVPMYFLISGWGYDERRYAATKFFLYTMFGSAFMLVGILATAFLHADGGPVTFDLVTLAEDQGVIALTTGRWLFLSFAIAFAVKVPLFPVHTWLPDAHTQAPTAGSVILRRHAEAGHVRVPALRPLPVPRGRGVGRARPGHARGDRHRLRRHLRHHAEGPQAGGGLLLGGPPRLHRPGHLLHHHPGPPGLGPPDGQPRKSTGALFLVGMIYERRHTREIAAAGL
jgi:NADH:ubiquinone oxidoreductase subunit 4 (subunit M)